MNKKISYTIYNPHDNADDDNGKNYIPKKNTLIICLPSLGDLKEEYRFLIPLLVDDGYKVIAMDHRGLGKSDVGFSSYLPEDCGNDVIALIDELLQSPNGEDVVIIGNSYAGASAVWVAAERPKLVRGIILLNAFVRDHPMPCGMPTLLSILCNDYFGPSFWPYYHKTLYTIKPSPVLDLIDYCTQLKQNLTETGRMHAVKQQMFASKSRCTDRLHDISQTHTPVLAIFGDKDPDFKAPDGCEIEAKWIIDNAFGGKKATAESIAVNGSGTGSDHVAYYVLVEGAGHYPHVECPTIVANHVKEFIGKAQRKDDK